MKFALTLVLGLLLGTAAGFALFQITFWLVEKFE